MRKSTLSVSTCAIPILSWNFGVGQPVTVPDNPTLTQSILDDVTRLHTWVLDIEFSISGWNGYQSQLTDEWQTNGPAEGNELVTQAQSWEKIRKLKEEQQLALRAQQQPVYLQFLRRPGAPDSDKLLLEGYRETHQVLVGGGVPLIQRTVWQAAAGLEWTLDVNLTASQRLEHQKFLVEFWNHSDEESKKVVLKTVAENQRAIAKLKGPARAWIHTRYLPGYLQFLRQANSEETKWQLALYESAHKPGGERNPVLTSGEPPLTGEMVASYCDYLDWVLGLTGIGGLSPKQRQIWQEYMVSDWNKEDQTGKTAIVELLKRFTDLHQLGTAQLREAFHFRT